MPRCTSDRSSSSWRDRRHRRRGRTRRHRPLQGVSSHVMFLARGKVGPFRVETEPMPGADGTVAVRTRHARRRQRRPHHDGGVVPVPFGVVQGGSARETLWAWLSQSPVPSWKATSPSAMTARSASPSSAIRRAAPSSGCTARRAPVGRSRWRPASTPSSAQIRLIGIDRPGIGSSTPYQYDTVFAFADDLRTIADTLGIDKMTSSGCPAAARTRWRARRRCPTGWWPPASSAVSPRRRARTRSPAG